MKNRIAQKRRVLAKLPAASPVLGGRCVEKQGCPLEGHTAHRFDPGYRWEVRADKIESPRRAALLPRWARKGLAITQQAIGMR